MPVCLWGRQPAWRPRTAGCGERRSSVFTERAPLRWPVETVDQDMLDQFRPAYEKMVFAGDARELMGCIDLYEFWAMCWTLPGQREISGRGSADAV